MAIIINATTRVIFKNKIIASLLFENILISLALKFKNVNKFKKN